MFWLKIKTNFSIWRTKYILLTRGISMQHFKFEFKQHSSWNLKLSFWSSLTVDKLVNCSWMLIVSYWELIKCTPPTGFLVYYQIVCQTLNKRTRNPLIKQSIYFVYNTFIKTLIPLVFYAHDISVLFYENWFCFVSLNG